MGKRYLQVTHIYSIEMPEEALDDPDFHSICNRGVSIMEERMKQVNPNMRDLVSSWETMPLEYAPIEDTPQTGSAHRGRRWESFSPEEKHRMQTQGVTFVDDIMGGVGGVVHPHDEGAHFFPKGHPFREAEDQYLAGEAEVIEEGDDEQKQIEP